MANAREQLAAAAEWLGWNDEDLSAGLRNAFDGLRLYDYAQAHPELPEMADEWETQVRQEALGYDPLVESLYRGWYEAETTGATEVANALKAACKLLDSVAYVAEVGDTEKVLKIANGLMYRSSDVTQSLAEAKEISGTKLSRVVINGNETETFVGKIMGVTNHHVVQSLGKMAAIHHKDNLDRVPVMNELLTIVYDGVGKAQVSGKTQYKGVSR